MVLLSCNRKKDARGTVYIETASLDGEKNLKPRIAISEIMDLLDSQGSEEQLLGRFRAKINCREPDPDLHHFDGVIKIDEQEFALSPK
jgi:phospholipid-transporting ATPase